MATNIDEIIKNLCNVYDFRDKTIISVGAGGGQLVDYSRVARQVIAVDNDPAAIESLQRRLKQKSLEDKFKVFQADFFDIRQKADVVLFEFSLHEIVAGENAIRHARSMASDVVILDHAQGSEWAFYVNEEEKVAASMQTVRKSGIRNQKDFQAWQTFGDYSELAAKVAPQGAAAIERISRFKHTAPIQISMSYSIIVL